MLRTITVSLAERVLISKLLNTCTKGDVQTSRTIRALRQDLDLRTAVRVLDAMIARAQEEKIAPPNWEDLLDLASLPDDDLLKARQQERVDVFFGVSADAAVVLKRFAPKDYTVDETHLAWLRDQISGHDWAKQVGTDGKEMTIAVGSDLQEVNANVADAVARSLERRGENEP